MTPIEQFMIENMPLNYHAVYSLKRGENAAVISGGVAVCDACGQVLAVARDICGDRERIKAAVLRLNCEQPPIERFFSELEKMLAVEKKFEHISLQ